MNSSCTTVPSQGRNAIGQSECESVPASPLVGTEVSVEKVPYDSTSNNKSFLEAKSSLSNMFPNATFQVPFFVAESVVERDDLRAREAPVFSSIPELEVVNEGTEILEEEEE